MKGKLKTLTNFKTEETYSNYCGVWLVLLHQIRSVTLQFDEKKKDSSPSS